MEVRFFQGALQEKGESVLSNPEEQDLSLNNFFRVIFKDAEGWVYVATKTAGAATSWRREWFEWPKHEDRLVKFVLDQSAKKEVYYGPALYKSRGSATKDNFLGSNFFWVDFDGNAPREGDSRLVQFEPSLAIQSSHEGHQHWYFSAGSFITDISRLEQINRKLATILDADISGWDGVQVLRPPGSFNFKRNTGTSWILSTESIFNVDVLASFPDPPPLVVVELPTNLPDLQEVIAKHKFKGEVWNLFRNGAKEGKRSEGLMALGYFLAEMGLANDEMLVLLHDADSRWGKFAGRNDQVERLLQIVSIARTKFPANEGSLLQGRFQKYGFLSLLATEVKLEWIWEGLLQRNGYLLLTGAPKVGKTQFSIDFAAKAVLGLPFLERPIARKDMRIGVLSLEMGLADLKYFVENQARGYKQPELDILEENLRLYPVGEPVYLNRQSERDELEELIHEERLDGLIIDSLGSTVEGELTNEGMVKDLMDWNDRIRNRHDCFTWFIHHHRKASGDNKKPNKLADIYGSYLITARVTTALTLWDTGTKAIMCIPNAVRLSETPKSFHVFRDANLHYTLTNTGIAVVGKQSGKVLNDPAPVEAYEELLENNTDFLDQFKDD